MRAWLSVAGIAASTLVAGPAFADRAVVLPTIGNEEELAQKELQIDIARAMQDLEHELVEERELQGAMHGVEDGVADTPTEYVAVGEATNADWVVVGTIEPAVLSDRVEIHACLVNLGRVESVAREVDKTKAREQIREMLQVLLRPEGIGVGAMPWEQRPPPEPPSPPTEPQQVAVEPPPPVQVAAPPPESPPQRGPRKIHMDYMFDRHDVWPPYSAGNPFIVGVAQGFSVAAVTPSGASGDRASIVGLVRGGYAPTDLGLEAMAELGGNLFGPRALFVDLAVRWMLTPSVLFDDDRYGGSFHMGPRIYGGAFVRFGETVTGPGGQSFSSDTTTHPMLGGTIDMALQATPELGVEGSVGDLRWVPGDDGSILLLGATLGGSLRF